MSELTNLIISDNIEAPVVILPDGKKEYQDIGTTIEDLRATYPTCYLQEVENANDFAEDTRKIHRSKNYELQSSKVYILHEAANVSKDETMLKVFVQLQSDLEQLKDQHNKYKVKFLEGGSEPSSNSDLSKSPRSESSGRCNLCHALFSIFRIRRQCKMCNLEYCTDCCYLKLSYPSYFGNFNKPHITCKNCIPIVFKLRHVQTDMLSLDPDVIPSSILKILKKKKKSPRKLSDTPIQSPPEIHIHDKNNNNNISSIISDPTISSDPNSIIVYDRKNELKNEAKPGWRDLLSSQKDRYKKHKKSKSAGKISTAALISLVPEIVYSSTAIPSRLENGTFYTAGESSISLLLKFLDPIFRIAYWSSGIKEGAVFDRKLVEAAMKSVPMTATKAKVQFTFPVPEIWPKIDSSEEERNILRENAFKSSGDDPNVSRILTLGFYPKKYKSFSSSKLPAVIWFHGGGFCLGHVHDVLYEGICSFISDTVGCIALAVEYRLAPEYKFPTQVEDCYASLLWIYNHAEELNIDVDRIAIAGDSAGGTIAAVVALMARDRLGPSLARQILIYPCLIDPTNESIESHFRYANGPVLPKKTLSWMLEHLLEDKSYSTHPYVTPLNSDDLSGLPSTTIINALHDPLRDHGDIYAKRLRKCGIKVTRTVYRRTPHAFFGVNGINESDEALMEVCWSLSEAFKLI